jgi:general secretion pathway protein G
MKHRRGTRLARRRGVTLIEVLIVVAIMALVSAAVAVAAMKYYDHAKKTTTATNAQTLREAVKGWWALYDSSRCPTVNELVTDGILDEVAPRKDPWGTAWRIECNGSAVVVTSDGPDRQPGTSDDIRVPPKSSS